MTNGTASSMANITAVESIASEAGAWCAYQPTQVGNRLRLVVVAERRQPPPGLVAAQQLGDPGEEGQLERQPPHQPPGSGAGLGSRSVSGSTPSCRRIQHGEEAGLEQQDIPLEREEVLARHRQREVRQPERGECRDRREARDGGDGQRDAGPAEPQQQGVARPEPEEGRQPVVRFRPLDFVDTLQVRGGREEAVRADQAGQLRGERHEREEVDEAEETEEQCAGEREARRFGGGRRGGPGHGTYCTSGGIICGSGSPPLLGGRSTVGHAALDRGIGVRIPASQHLFAFGYALAGRQGFGRFAATPLRARIPAASSRRFGFGRSCTLGSVASRLRRFGLESLRHLPVDSASVAPARWVRSLRGYAASGSNPCGIFQ